jgi:cytochrome c biogenesis protein CcmG/thiol:disulfide interchange protein DsbE
MEEKMRVYLPLLLFAALCVVMVFGIRNVRENEPASPMIGKKFPALTLSKEMIDIAASHEVTLVNFFASWCLPCGIEHPALLALSKKNVLPMIGIAWKNKPEDVKLWLANRKNPYVQIFNDAAGDSTVPLGLTGVPETFIVGKDGVIAYHTKQPLSEEIVRTEILPLVERLKKE